MAQNRANRIFMIIFTQNVKREQMLRIKAKLKEIKKNRSQHQAQIKLGMK